MNEALKLIARFKEIDEEIKKLYREAHAAGDRVKFGHIHSPMKTIGKLDFYKALHNDQNQVLDKLGIHRYWENFGDDGASEVIDLIETVIKKFRSSCQSPKVDEENGV